MSNTGRTCPGINDFTRPKPEVYTCPNCGSKVEIWTDEQSAECENCGTVVSKKVSSCLDWCEYAQKCKQLIEEKKEKQR
jgi:DNA-directed RNA polymerase subunit RPC12/RpoP